MSTPDLGQVRADPGQLEQVLINLAVNARDALPGGGKLAMETSNAFLDKEFASHHPDVVPGSYVTLAVTDNGTGMREEVKARIFEPFFTTKEQGKGTGLGLSTCYGIVMQHGGYISVYSELDEGTTFRIYLPRVNGMARDRPYGEVSDHLPRGGETVLLVEDEETLRKMTGRVLRQQGYTVLEAENGGEALRIVEEFAERQVDLHLVLTDIIMPLMGGRELVYHLRSRQTNTKVLYTSGYTDGTVVQHGHLEAGSEFLPKPFTPHSLARRVREVLDSASEPADLG